MDYKTDVFNNCQSTIESLKLQNRPEEVQEQFYHFINNIPFIQSMISIDRKRAKDLPRDNKGRIIVDVIHPHILENMDYFRPAAIHFEQTGHYCDYRPSRDPNSPFHKWYEVEMDRIWNGMVRPEDGEWITGELYWYLNYTRMTITERIDDTNAGNKIESFPKLWDGVYLRAHFQYQARYGGLYYDKGGLHSTELARRGASKSYWGASQLSRLFVCGENAKTKRSVRGVIAASSSEYLTKDGTLNKFIDDINFLATNTQFPSHRLVESIQKMTWQMGYIDLNKNIQKGTKNLIIGVTTGDNVGKVRGKRATKVLLEEAGTFPKLDDIMSIIFPCVQEGNVSFGQLCIFGTAGDKKSDFSALKNFMYNPKAYYMYHTPNVYDENSLGREFTFFFAGYMNRMGYVDENGNSDVIGALVELLDFRFIKKYNSDDPNAILKTIAEDPITPKEAIIQSNYAFFPKQVISNRLDEISNNPNELDTILTGEVIIDSTGKPVFRQTHDDPIRMYPIKGNKYKGAVEIYKLPEVDSTGNVPSNRYIFGIDPYDKDISGTQSLGSIFGLDLWTDQIVCEYTGRPETAEYFYEMCRALIIMYNGTANYENNVGGTFGYFSRMNSIHLLCDTPPFLRDMDIIKGETFGNTVKGTRATTPVNNKADALTKAWLTLPRIKIVKGDNDKDIETTVNNIAFIRNKAFLMELLAYSPEINVDRIRSFGMLMLLREQKMILYNGDFKEVQKEDKSYLGNDDFFSRNYKTTNDNTP